MDRAALPARGREVRDGLRDIAPAAIAAVPISLLFGAIAVGKGLSPLEATLMSLLVFAGGAQFAAIETWTYPPPIVALAFATFLINLRHVLMGASLAPKMRAPRVLLFPAFHLLTDESWALAERRALEQPVTLAYWLAMAGTLPFVFVGGSALGALLGSFMGDPARLGADFAFTALFIGLIAGFGRSRVTLVTIAASAVVAALAYRFLGSPWHVATGAVAGIAAAYLTAPEDAP